MSERQDEVRYLVWDDHDHKWIGKEGETARSPMNVKWIGLEAATALRNQNPGRLIVVNISRTS